MAYQFNQNEIDNFYKKIAKNVSRLRREKGLSQLELSLEIGYKSCSLVGGAEAGYKNIHFNLEHLYKISKVLDIEMAEFFKEF
ncbi:helix-turn-helix transcriptional regulator [Campylobacter sp. TTU-622]|uniref:helix-turn-helix domain-containing protein n=1 Tax=unclassified Campylobacter TaxID=2593542 RepID=UPI001906527A|nr:MULTISPECIES: helix-turn-helix transcriptional regulator [unclassified Campylobacter]MBK1971345.1 helix-turn-helix transcriptional regulator [Campylobacter sp. TTU_617]MBK1972518.1 helix-turn-helix transcriptional regulator [Campylobacter sp. TTU-622]MBK1991048.1 helix-turn-helix transcriptional regulator [Campylobacter sp. 2018MI34]